MRRPRGCRRCGVWIQTDTCWSGRLDLCQHRRRDRIGLALDRAGKPSESVAAFREAVQLNCKSAEAHLNLGKMELAVSHLNEAIAELQFTLRLNPGDRQAKRLLSQAYRRAGDTKNAEKLAEASREDPVANEDSLVGDFIVPQWQTPPKVPEK